MFADDTTFSSSHLDSNIAGKKVQNVFDWACCGSTNVKDLV